MHSQTDRLLINNTAKLISKTEILKINFDRLGEFANSLNFLIRNKTNPLDETTPNKDEIELIFLFSCINFCFWNEKEWYFTFKGKKYSRSLGLSLYLNNYLKSSEEKPSYLLKKLKFLDFEKDLNKNQPLKFVKERFEFLNQGADFLIKNYNGSFINFLEDVQFKEDLILNHLSKELSFFEDVQTIDQLDFPFLKKLKVVISRLGDLISTKYSGTLAADYRLPQYFRHLGILEYSDSLANTIDGQSLIKKDSAEEIAIRASVIVIGEKIMELLSKEDSHINCYTLDKLLWESAKKTQMIKPHHRTETVFY